MLTRKVALRGALGASVKCALRQPPSSGAHAASARDCTTEWSAPLRSARVSRVYITAGTGAGARREDEEDGVAGARVHARRVEVVLACDACRNIELCRRSADAAGARRTHRSGVREAQYGRSSERGAHCETMGAREEAK